jgi:signal transduction histidine kinase
MRSPDRPQRLELPRPALVDNALGVVCGVALIVESFLPSLARGPVIPNLVSSVAIGVCIAFWRRRPLAATTAFMAIALCREAWLVRPEQGIVTSAIALVLFAYAVARYEPVQRAMTGLAVMEGGLVAIVSVSPHGLENIIFPAIVFVLSPWIAGRTLRNRLVLARELEERAVALEADRQNSAQRAVIDERRRIARELHDVVAHSLSVMVIQAGAGRRQVDEHPDRAAECAELIERLGRETLAEMRVLLGVMRPEAATAARSPHPGLAGLQDLVSRARAAGLPVELHITGAAIPLPPGLDLTAYRVVQEALTNTLKHAGPARTDVSVRYASDGVELEIANDAGSTAAVRTPGPGHGLVGMRERAAIYGGEVTAGPVDGGGWLVRARLRVPAAAAEVLTA